MLRGDQLARYPRIIVELGMGDGRLLESIAKKDRHSLYVGIEIDGAQFKQAKSQISADNVMLIEGSFETLIPTLPADCVDSFLAVLPDPAFIDPSKQDTWKIFYKNLLAKLKRGGAFQLVTELTDELLQPVSNDEFQRWTRWLEQAFMSLGFAASGSYQGAPDDYSSRCLDQFRGDPGRIRMVTMNFTKP